MSERGGRGEEEGGRAAVIAAAAVAAQLLHTHADTSVLSLLSLSHTVTLSVSAAVYVYLFFTVTVTGVHQLCFDNRMSTVSGKLVSFHLYVGDALHKRDAANAQSLSPLEQAVVKTSEGMHAMRDNIGYLKAREERHAQSKWRGGEGKTDGKP